MTDEVYTSFDVRDAARAWRDAGFTVLPVRADGTKAPALDTWRSYVTNMPTDAEHDRWFGGQPAGLGLLCGSVSGNLEMFELEGRAIAEGARDRLIPALKGAGVHEIWTRLVQGYAEFTPSGGLHLLYRITDHAVPGNYKIAQRPARDDELTADEQALRVKHPNKVIVRCLAETRGQAGFVVVAPSHGPTHPNGQPWTLCNGSAYGQVPTLTWEERNALHRVIHAALDDMPTPERPPTPARRTQQPSGDERPGDAWARQTGWNDILEPHGWRWIYRRSDMDFWCRPGKNIGVSARTGGQYDSLYVWSTSTEFDAEQSITKFRAYAVLEHQGDDRAAGAELRRRGFGATAPTVVRERQPVEPAAPTDDLPPEPDEDPGEPSPVVDPEVQAVRLPNLPEMFWSARERFAVIRRAAWHAGCGADMVLLGVLCRLSAMRSHLLTFDLGQGEGSLNLFGGAVGGTGLGKSRANTAARKILLRPPYLALPDGEVDEEKFKDGIGLGTGEGMAEAYMGMVDEPTGDVAKRNTKYVNAGDPITKPVRRQTRHNTYFYMDEGEHLTKTMVERSGATIGPAIRTAWIAGALGQQNAKDETTRFIGEGTYSMGMVIGYQPSTVQVLLADGAAGTPQRFLWLSGWDPAFPLIRPDVVKPFHLPIARADGKPLVGIIKGPQWLADQLWEQRHSVVTGDVEVLEKNSHETLMRCKLASLLALVDDRMDVNDEDWQLAEVIWNTSAEIRDALTEIGKREAKRVARERNAAAAEAALSSHTKVKEYEANVERVARLVAKKVYAAGEMTQRGPKRELESKDRPLYDAALSRALNAEWLVLNDRQLVPGPSKPA